LIKHKRLKEAWNLSWKKLSDELGGLPAIKYHCGILAVGALKRAIRAYYKDRKRPDWLPRGLTADEKQVLEEEKLIEELSKRLKK
ncbi:MAG: iron-sulfur cluster assembly scaffold protein, partial [Deltaproteobacteria bacterium]